MPTIPAAMLKQLYKRGSLRNAGPGWEFAMRNHLASATLVGIGLTLDGVEVAPQAITVSQPEANVAVPAGAITPETPIRFPTQIATMVQVAGAPLDPGSHDLAIRADTREIGPVTIAVSDTVAE